MAVATTSTRPTRPQLARLAPVAPGPRTTAAAAPATTRSWTPFQALPAALTGAVAAASVGQIYVGYMGSGLHVHGCAALSFTVPMQGLIPSLVHPYPLHIFTS